MHGKKAPKLLVLKTSLKDFLIRMADRSESTARIKIIFIIETQIVRRTPPPPPDGRIVRPLLCSFICVSTNISMRLRFMTLNLKCIFQFVKLKSKTKFMTLLNFCNFLNISKISDFQNPPGSSIENFNNS